LRTQVAQFDAKQQTFKKALARVGRPVLAGCMHMVPQPLRHNGRVCVLQRRHHFGTLFNRRSLHPHHRSQMRPERRQDFSAALASTSVLQGEISRQACLRLRLGLHRSNAPENRPRRPPAPGRVQPVGRRPDRNAFDLGQPAEGIEFECPKPGARTDPGRWMAAPAVLF
jgi:hypothetical protein